MNATLIETISVGNVLGEGVLWDDLEGRVWWTDIQERLLFRYALKSRSLETFNLPERLGSFGFVQGSDRIIAAFESGFAFFHPTSGCLEWIVRPEHAGHNLRFNDGRVDREGRFWAGSMVEGEGEPLGKLYCLSKGRLVLHRTDIAISNSLCFSLDGRHVYFADTPHRKILRFNCDAASGELSEPIVFAHTAPEAFPDGSTVDAQGHVWNAQWGSSHVVRYAPDGSISGTISLPVTQPTCVAFAGEELNLLCITTARQGLDRTSLEGQPQAGHVFIYETDICGCAEPRYIER